MRRKLRTGAQYGAPANGDAITYDHLVICTGVKLDWDKVAGLRDALGRNDVCSNYSPHIVELHLGVRADSSNPATKSCARSRRCRSNVQARRKRLSIYGLDPLRRCRMLKLQAHFFTHAPAIFGVPYFARALVKVAARYGIDVHYQQHLVAVDGPAKPRRSNSSATQGRTETVPFDLLHVSPPQSPHEEIKKSARQCRRLGRRQSEHDAARALCQRLSLGDVCSTPNSKTAAAVRKQAPVW